MSKPTGYSKNPVPLTSLKGFEKYGTRSWSRSKPASISLNKLVRPNRDLSEESLDADADPLSLDSPSPKPDQVLDEATEIIVPVLGDDGDYDDIAADDDESVG